MQSCFVGLWHRLNARGDPRTVFEQLVAAYSTPSRYYHSFSHLLDCLEQLHDARDGVVHPEQVEIAIWFHDAIYDPVASDNEEQSAAWARESLTAAAVEPTFVNRIAELILATQHKTIPTDRDAALMVDVDLSILGRQPDVFDNYDRQIRLEYDWVPEKEYCERRAQILKGFLSRPTIYRTDHFFARYEQPARKNLSRTIARLQHGLL